MLTKRNEKLLFRYLIQVSSALDLFSIVIFCLPLICLIYLTFQRSHNVLLQGEPKLKKRKRKKNSPIKNSCLLQYISQVNVSIQEIWIQCNSFLKMMNCQPYFSLCIEYTPQITPSNSKIRTCFNCF